MSLWQALLHRQLSEAISKGGLTVAYPDGASRSYGEEAPNSLAVRINSEAWLRRLVFDPGLALGEAYMEGGLDIANGDIFDLLDLIWINVLTAGKVGGSAPAFFQHALRRLSQLNFQGRARKNASHHYDIGNDLYRLFLDKDLQYSCGIFESSSATLEDAQFAKKCAIARKLLIEPDQSVLDIGCGWGGLGLHLAEYEHARVTGVTLSSEQLRLARERALSNGRDGQVEFRLQDYRSLDGHYDRIVSVGMFEHVGLPHYQEYFDRVARLLKDDGAALIHTIGRTRGPGATDPWIGKYIFPGGYIPALSEILPAIESAGLLVLDIEILRLHYAETLKRWRRRFHANLAQIERRYDQRFIRMWDYYLAASELSFRHGEHVVFQIQLAKRQDAAPLTRHYLYARNDALHTRRQTAVA
jgi:cyclopropane-fatty-acyl-phospholipid synthase